MPKRKSTEDEIVKFFTEAHIEAATLMLNIVKGIVARRLPAKVRKPKKPVAVERVEGASS